MFATTPLPARMKKIQTNMKALVWPQHYVPIFRRSKAANSVISCDQACMQKWCLHFVNFVSDLILLILAGDENKQLTLNSIFGQIRQQLLTTELAALERKTIDV